MVLISITIAIYTSAIYPVTFDVLTTNKTQPSAKNFLRVYQHFPKKQVHCRLHILDYGFEISDFLSKG